MYIPRGRKEGSDWQRLRVVEALPSCAKHEGCGTAAVGNLRFLRMLG